MTSSNNSASDSPQTEREGVTEEPGSISVAAMQLRQGNAQAAEVLGEFFWKRVVSLARKKLKQRVVPAKDVGASDVAQDALLAFFRALRAGRYEFLDDRDGLWALLAKITDNKVKDWKRRQTRRAARGLVAHGGSALPLDSEGAPRKLAEIAADAHPTPADEAEYAEACLAACQSVLVKLNDRQNYIVLGKAAGMTNAQLAKKLDCTERTVELNLAAIRREARKLGEEERP